MSTWSFRGIPLDDLGIVTLVSDSFKMPTRRGGNVMIPHLDGRVHTRKKFDQRSMALGLEVVEDSIQELEAAVDAVKALLAPRSLGELSQTMEDLTVRTIQAEYTGDLNPTRVSPISVKFMLEFVMPDPFFRLSTIASDTRTIDASPTTYDVHNQGTVDERNPRIVLTGPLNNTVITNTTNGVVLSYNAEILDGHYVVIETNANGEYTAVDDLAANVIGNVSHAGDSALFVLDVGVNALSIEDDTATTGAVTFEFYPPFV